MSDFLQKNTSGPNIGRDQYNFNTVSVNHHKLSRLFKKFEEEYKNDEKFNGILEDLERFTIPKINHVIGLEDKLLKGNRADLIEYALEVKELYAKRLVKYQFYQSAQKINVYLLALVVTYFRNYITPLIESGASDSVVNSSIVREIVNPLLSILSDDEIIDFNAEHVSGMLYYLTGNCHINWS